MGGYGLLPGSTTVTLDGSHALSAALAWRSHYQDPTGYYYLGARYYDPQAGRFLSPDPMGHGASMSLYDYCDGDPVNGLDPDGRLVTGGIGAGVDMVVGLAHLGYNGVGSVAYAVTSAGGLLPNRVSDVYADQWHGLQNTGSGFSTLGDSLGYAAGSAAFLHDFAPAKELGVQLTGGADRSAGYRTGYAITSIASLFAGGEGVFGKAGSLGKTAEVASTSTKVEVLAAKSNLVRGTTDVDNLAHYVWKAPTGRSMDLMLDAETVGEKLVINDAHIMPTDGIFATSRNTLNRSGLQQLANDLAGHFKINTIEIPNSIGRGSSGAIGSFGNVRINIVNGKAVISKM